MAWGVDDVDARTLVGDGGTLGENGDAALSLQLVGVHGAFLDHFATAKVSSLLEQSVDQRGLSVVNVSDNGDISYIWASGHRCSGAVC